MHNCAPYRAPRIRQHYRGFAPVGRCGTGTVRSGGKAHGKIRHFWNEGRVFLGREACLARGRVENTCRMRSSTPTLPPWPIDGAPCGSNLPAMAAKREAEVSKATCFTARANGDPPINTCQMRGSTPALPPWPIDGALRGSNLSAMAAKCGAEVSKVACFTTRTKAQPP